MSTIPSTIDRPQLGLREFVTILQGRKWWVLSVAGLVVAATLVYSFGQTPIYGSRATIVVKPISVSPGFVTGYVNTDTEQQLAQSGAVAKVAQDKLNEPVSIGELLSGLSTEAPLDTEIIHFNYAHPDPQEAQERAQAFADGYLEYRRTQAVNDLLASSDALEERIRALNQRLEELKDDIAATSDPTEKATLEAQSTSLVGQLGVLQQRLTDLTPPDNLRVGQVVQPATLASSPSSPNHARDAVLGIVLGLLAGVGVALLRERLDDGLRGRQDLASHLAAPVLAVVPRDSTWRKGDETRLATIAEPRSGASEAYRTLRTGVLFSAAQRGAKVLMVTSAKAGEGKSTTVANLGIVLAQAGKRCIVVSADLRKPRLHRFFGVETDLGLTNALIGDVRLTSALTRVGIDNLVVLPSGPIPANPPELLGSDAMAALLRDLRDIADFVLIDTTPVLAIADAITLGQLCDAILFVADPSISTRGAVTHARQQLDQVRAFIMGAILNNFVPMKAALQPYYDYAYMRYGEQRDREPRLERRA
jgi:succinoglycan biosynthesis transport protein ExoP